MTRDDGYNGWANYETWAVGMFLDGNYDGPSTYYETIERVRDTIAWQDDARDKLDRPYWTREESRRYAVADALKEWVEENVQPHTVDDDHPDPQLHPLVADLLGAALSEVDWHELADAWIEAVNEQVSA